MGIIDVPIEMEGNCCAKSCAGGGGGGKKNNTDNGEKSEGDFGKKFGGGGGGGGGYKKRLLVYVKIMNIWVLSKCVLFLVTLTNVMVFRFRCEHY